MDELNEKSIASCKLWKDAGKPRSGSIFTIYRRITYARVRGKKGSILRMISMKPYLKNKAMFFLEMLKV